MNIYIDGQEIGGVSSFEIDEEIEHKQVSSISSILNKEVTLTMENVETNIRMMSEKSRTWCKQIKRDGKIYW